MLLEKDSAQEIVRLCVGRVHAEDLFQVAPRLDRLAGPKEASRQEFADVFRRSLLDPDEPRVAQQGRAERIGG